MVEKKSLREAYGKTLCELGAENNKIVVLDADLSSSTQTKMFAKQFPNRFFNSGIAEQDMITTAAGLASQGKIPFVSTFAMFATGRTYDQIRNSICYPKFNVKIVATHGGVTVGEDGASHQALTLLATLKREFDINYIIDSSPKKTDCYSPVSHIQIKLPDIITSDAPELIIIMAPAFSNEITKQIHSLTNKVKYILAIKDDKILYM